MKNVFRVTIYYRDNTNNQLSVIAPDDLVARRGAITYDAKTYSDNGYKQPKIRFCKVEFLCDAIEAK